MKNKAKKYSKILYFVKNSPMKNVITKRAEMTAPATKLDKSYPFNCVSRHYPLANMLPREENRSLILPCGFKNGESWGALRKAWIGYKVAKAQNDEVLMREYATRIQTLETQLGIPTASFPNLGILGDIFFLYDKNKERELRQQYMFDKVVCDRFDVDNVQELVDNGEAKLFDNQMQLKNYRDQEYYAEITKVMVDWAFSDKGQAKVAAAQRKWNRRDEVRDEIKQIKGELATLKNKGDRGQTRIDKRNKRMQLLHDKIMKESELTSIETMTMIKTDTGWKYAKEILENNRRERINYDYVPQYYLTDLNGRRLGNYKEEQEQGYAADPYFYRLYLENKEWEKIYSKEQNVK